MFFCVSCSKKADGPKDVANVMQKPRAIADTILAKPTDTIQLIRKYHQVLILGNSITFTIPDPSIGWENDWGMAATKPENDYVHLLTAKLKLISPDIKINLQQVYSFEESYATYDYVTAFAAAKALHPDLIIMRFGENISKGAANTAQFDAVYGSLIAYFKDGNPNVHILAAGSFWGNPVVDESMKKYSKFVSLSPLLNNPANQAFGQYADYGVSIHPSDLGMKEISDIIWKGLDGL